MYQKSNPIKHIKDIVTQVTKSIRHSPAKEISHLQDTWVQVVGPAFAGKTKVVSLEKSTLKIQVESASLRHELECYMKQNLLIQLQEKSSRKILALKFLVNNGQ